MTSYFLITGYELSYYIFQDAQVTHSCDTRPRDARFTRLHTGIKYHMLGGRQHITSYLTALALIFISRLKGLELFLFCKDAQRLLLLANEPPAVTLTHNTTFQ